jgi:hypothetical protein
MVRDRLHEITLSDFPNCQTGQVEDGATGAIRLWIRCRKVPEHSPGVAPQKERKGLPMCGTIPSFNILQLVVSVQRTFLLDVLLGLCTQSGNPACTLGVACSKRRVRLREQNRGSDRHH